MTQPYKHQVEGFERLKANQNYALLCEMGSGKSRMICMDFEHKIRTGDASAILIIAPSGSYRNWEIELRKWLSPELAEKIYVYAWVSSTFGVGAAREFENFLSYAGDRPRALLVNVEALSRVDKIKDGVKRYLASAPAIVVVDEAQCIKSPTSARTKFVHSLASLARFRRVLSGLIAPENPLNVFAPLFFLNWNILGFPSFFAFRARYAVMKKVNYNNGSGDINVVVGYRHLEELQRKIERASFRVRTADVVDLPERIYMPLRYVELTPEQSKMYEQMKKWAVAEYGGKHITTQIAAGVVQKLQQIVNGCVYDEGGSVVEVPSNKIASLLELLDDFGGKAIIWAQSPVFLEKIASALQAEYGGPAVERFWGEVSSRQREVAKKRFQEDPTCRFMVANTSVGGEGNNWTEASLVVYISNSYKNSERQQSEARAHRIGTRHPVTYVDIAARGTVDEKIIKALREKMDVSSLLSGDELLKWVI